MGKQFQTSKKPREVIEFTIDDDTYHFTPHKVASITLPVFEHGIDVELPDDDDDAATRAAMSMTQRSWEWLHAGLADGEYERLRRRLKDPSDDLDVPDVMDITRWLMTQVTGRPTR